jgi:hypothetical protein
LIVGFPRNTSPTNVETAATTAAHHAPKSRAADMCIMNEVEPFAAKRSCVLRLSRRVATKTNVASGHQPGNGSRISQTTIPQTAAANATAATNRRIRSSRAIGGKRLGTRPIDLDLRPGRSLTPAEQTSQEVGNRCEQVHFQHERHPPSRIQPSGSGKPRYGPPDAPLDQLSANLRYTDLTKTGVPLPCVLS